MCELQYIIERKEKKNKIVKINRIGKKKRKKNRKKRFPSVSRILNLCFFFII